MSWTNQSKSANPTFSDDVRHGIIPHISDIASSTFNDQFDDTGIIIKDMTFTDLTTNWSNQTRN